MTRGRSPMYPQMALAEAIERIRRVYSATHTYEADKESLAKSLGYNTLNGASLSTIGTLRRYGLLEDSGTGMKVSENAVTLVELPEDDSARQDALRTAAFWPPLFASLKEDFPSKLPSDVHLRHHLIKKKFLPKAADEVIRIYRANLELVAAEQQDYDGGGMEEEQNLEGQPPMSQSRIIETHAQNTPTASQTLNQPLPALQIKGVHEFSFPLSIQRDVKAVVTIYGANLKRRDLEFLKKKVGDLVEGFEDEEEPQLKTAPIPVPIELPPSTEREPRLLPETTE